MIHIGLCESALDIRLPESLVEAHSITSHLPFDILCSLGENQVVCHPDSERKDMEAEALALYDTHIHTTLCRHARGEPKEYAAVAEERGLKGIVITCHNPMPNGWSQAARMYEDQFDEYIALVSRATEQFRDWMDVRLGLECDYYPGVEDYLLRQTESAEFHHILGSVHPHIPEYQKEYETGSPLDYQRTYFEHLALAAETGLFDTLAHPDFVKVVHPEEWILDRVMDDICRTLDRVAASGTAMELNTSGVLKIVPQMNPGPEILREMHARGIPVVISSDAHDPQRVGDGFVDALDAAEKAGYTQVSYFLERKRWDVDIHRLRGDPRYSRKLQ